jgi:hypothetical protein
MPKLSFPVDNGYYVSDSSPLSSSETINLYPSTPIAEGSSSRGGLFTFPGSSEFAKGTYFTSAGSYLFDDKLFVWGNRGRVVYFDSDGNETLVADVGLDTKDTTDGVYFADNGNVLCIVQTDSNRGWFWDSTNGLVEITDAAYLAFAAESGGVRTVAFVDGRFVFNTYESIFWGSLVTTNDGKDFDALAFLKPFLNEDARRVANVRGDLYVFGENRTKVYATTADQDLPYQEIPGATIDKGLAETLGLVVFDNSAFFVGGGLNERVSVWKIIGSGGVQKISTDSIDGLIENYTSTRFKEAGFMFTGRPFVWFQTASNIVVYDILSSSIKGYPVWFLKDELGLDGDLPGSGQVVEAFGKIMYLGQNRVNYFDGTNNFTNTTGGDDKPDPNTVRFSSAYLQNQSDTLVINRLELVMEVGVGLDPDTSIDYTDPKVQMEFSDDGARTWVDCGENSVGKNSQYDNKVVWHQLGLTKQSRIFRFTSTTGVPLRFHRIDIYTQGGVRNY